MSDPTIFVIHTHTADSARKHLWIFFDALAVKIVRARSYFKASEAWNKQYGKPIRLVRYKGLMRASEAAMIIADHVVGKVPDPSATSPAKDEGRTADA